MKNLMIAGLIVLTTTSSAMAHGGGLNRDGCHNNHSNGTYHCHQAQDNNSNHDVDKALGALLVLGLIAAVVNNQCATEWQAIGETATHIHVAEVDTCNGNIYQQTAVRK